MSYHTLNYVKKETGDGLCVSSLKTLKETHKPSPVSRAEKYEKDHR